MTWRRRIAGRKRSLSAIDQLPRLDQEVFHFVYEQGLPLQETLFHLHPKFPSLTETAITETIQRIKERLTPRQLRILQLRKTRHDLNYEMLSQNSVSFESIADPEPSPESLVIATEKWKALEKAFNELEPKEQVLIRLRFEKGLTLAQIAGLTGLATAQRVDYQIEKVIERIKKALSVD